MPTPAEEVAMELIRYHREELMMDEVESRFDRSVPTLYQRVVPRLGGNTTLYWRALGMVNEEDD